MMVTVGQWFAGLVGVAIVLIGARFLVQPAAAAAAFGVPVSADNAYLSVKGVRDIASGLFIGLLLWHGQPRLLGWFMLVATLIPIADGLISGITALASRRSEFIGRPPPSCWSRQASCCSASQPGRCSPARGLSFVAPSP